MCSVSLLVLGTALYFGKENQENMVPKLLLRLNMWRKLYLRPVHSDRWKKNKVSHFYVSLHDPVYFCLSLQTKIRNETQLTEWQGDNKYFQILENQAQASGVMLEKWSVPS
jgi:hypothetical protein